MAMVLNAIILKNFYYIIIIIPTSTPWSLLFKIKIKIKCFFFLKQIGPLSLTIMPTPFVKDVTTFFKPIYKCCWQQWGHFFHSSMKVP